MSKFAYFELERTFMKSTHANFSSAWSNRSVRVRAEVCLQVERVDRTWLMLISIFDCGCEHYSSVMRLWLKYRRLDQRQKNTWHERMEKQIKNEHEWMPKSGTHETDRERIWGKTHEKEIALYYINRQCVLSCARSIHVLIGLSR